MPTHTTSSGPCLQLQVLWLKPLVVSAHSLSSSHAGLQHAMPSGPLHLLISLTQIIAWLASSLSTGSVQVSDLPRPPHLNSFLYLFFSTIYSAFFFFIDPASETIYLSVTCFWSPPLECNLHQGRHHVHSQCLELCLALQTFCWTNEPKLNPDCRAFEAEHGGYFSYPPHAKLSHPSQLVKM